LDVAAIKKMLNAAGLGLTAGGKLRPCLLSNREIELKKPCVTGLLYTAEENGKNKRMLYSLTVTR
jgi:hypothetical protein